MNVWKIHLVIQTQLVITQKDLTCVGVIPVTMVMDSHVTVRKLKHETVRKNGRGEMNHSNIA